MPLLVPAPCVDYLTISPAYRLMQISCITSAAMRLISASREFRQHQGPVLAGKREHYMLPRAVGDQTQQNTVPLCTRFHPAVWAGAAFTPETDLLCINSPVMNNTTACSPSG